MFGPTPTFGSDGRFAAQVGIDVQTIDPAGTGRGCGAVATFSPPPARTAAGSAPPSDPAAADDRPAPDPTGDAWPAPDPTGDAWPADDPPADGPPDDARTAGDRTDDAFEVEQPVPTGALLAIVDTAARAAAEAAVDVPGRRTALTPTATGVQFREPARGTVTARASVPCEGAVTDRADDQGLFRFSVAVEVVDRAGARVASGTVQWLAQIDGTPRTSTG